MLRAGDRVGDKYTILRLIGDGGMGTVYEAQHERLGTRVALKFLHEDIAERPGLSERFLQEAKVAATIVSPHVVRVTDMDTVPGGPPYLVMEFVTGESLDHLLERETKLPPERAVAFALQIASGLEAAHAIGAVHRDLKPGNVLVTQAAEGPRLMLIDFGIAKVRDGSGGKGLTRTGVVLGTPEYMPPEQLFAASDVDARADVYALGVMLFEMLSGHRPAEGDSAEAIVGKVLAGDVRALSSLEPALPPALVDVVQRATAGDRDARFPSVAAMRGALEAAMRGDGRPPITVSDPPPERPPPAKGSTELGEPPRESLTPQRGSTELGAPIPAYGRASLPAAPPTRARKRSPAVVVVLLLLLGVLIVALVVVALGRRGPREIPPLPTAEAPPEPAPTSTETAAAPPTAVPATPPTATPATPAPRPTPTATSTPTPTPPTPTTTPTPTPAPDAGVLPIPLPFPIPSTLPPFPLPFPLPRTPDAGAPAPAPTTPASTPTPTTTSTAPKKPGIGRRGAESGQ